MTSTTPPLASLFISSAPAFHPDFISQEKYFLSEGLLMEGQEENYSATGKEISAGGENSSATGNNFSVTEERNSATVKNISGTGEEIFHLKPKPK
ncbi:MAG TPA: hypothetical protein VE978_12140 [Chitinophagales bacterium]|nr:hypothetical protein [Chitinophagales bacterium]